VRSCQMDVRHVGDHECIHCSKCMGACSQKALSLKCGKFTLISPEGGCAAPARGGSGAVAAQGSGGADISPAKGQVSGAAAGAPVDNKPDVNDTRAKYEKIGWGIALAVLCLALIWFNFLDPAVQKANAAPAATSGDAGQAGAGGAAGSGAAAGAGDESGQQAAQGTAGASAGQDSDGADSSAAGSSGSAAVGTDAAGTDANATGTAGSDSARVEADGTGSGETQSAAAAAYESTAPVGIAIGNQLTDFSAQMLDGSTFHLADHRGKVVFINMWATYCGPCVQELPVFQSFAQEHADDAVVIIVHASDPIDDVPSFLERKNVALPCTVDSLDDYIFNLCGASPSILPHTVVLNRKGEIVYNQSGSITDALLDEQYEKAK
ncbi:MAG: TlpA disulfide reductase family protein, partial [Eubacteriales bacterium]|nr:TlpA disulfide reductase family protein [Eubacteriales bacterium]